MRPGATVGGSAAIESAVKYEPRVDKRKVREPLREVSRYIVSRPGLLCDQSRWTGESKKCRHSRSPVKRVIVPDQRSRVHISGHTTAFGPFNRPYIPVMQ